jgi:hypothetical protein
VPWKRKDGCAIDPEKISTPDENIYPATYTYVRDQALV